MTCSTLQINEVVELSRQGRTEPQIASRLGLVWGHYRAALNQWRPDIAIAVRVARLEFLSELADQHAEKNRWRNYYRALAAIKRTQAGVDHALIRAHKLGLTPNLGTAGSRNHDAVRAAQQRLSEHAAHPVQSDDV